MGNFWSTSLLKLIGDGEYNAGCADLMINDDTKENKGIFARVFYPSTLKSENLVN